MSPTTRNTLMIGGALILIALLLVWGPLEGRFGTGGSKVDETPPVAAGPPADSAGALGAAAVGALAGAELGDAVSDVLAAASPDPCDEEAVSADGAEIDTSDCPPVAGEDDQDVLSGIGGPVVVAPGVAPKPAPAVVVAPRAPTPPVAAGVPDTKVAEPIAAATDPTPPTPPTTPTTPGDFDDALVAAKDSNQGVGPAGKIVERFAPPVAAPADPGFRVVSSMKSGPLILPCDAPGSGCRSTSGIAAGGGGGGGGNPPIVPGGPPPVPPFGNPPIVPGSPPPIPLP